MEHGKLGTIAAFMAASVLLGACSSGSRDRDDRYGSRYDRTDSFDRQANRREREREYRNRGEICREREVLSRNDRDRDGDGGRVAGTLAGAVVGGVIGHQIGDGRGNDVATVGGAAAGAIAGNQIAKNRDRDRDSRRREVVMECRPR